MLKFCIKVFVCDGQDAVRQAILSLLQVLFSDISNLRGTSTLEIFLVDCIRSER